MTPNKDQQSQDDRTVLEKDLAGIADGARWLLGSILGIAGSAVEGSQDFDKEERELAERQVATADSDPINKPRFPEHPGTKPLWK